MAQVIVRNVDDRVVAKLKRRAESHGHSLEQELREILAAATNLNRKDRVAMAARIRAMTPRQVTQVDSTLLVRQDRDNR